MIVLSRRRTFLVMVVGLLLMFIVVFRAAQGREEGFCRARDTVGSKTAYEREKHNDGYGAPCERAVGVDERALKDQNCQRKHAERFAKLAGDIDPCDLFGSAVTERGWEDAGQNIEDDQPSSHDRADVVYLCRWFSPDGNSPNDLYNAHNEEEYSMSRRMFPMFGNDDKMNDACNNGCDGAPGDQALRR